MMMSPGLFPSITGLKPSGLTIRRSGKPFLRPLTGEVHPVGRMNGDGADLHHQRYRAGSPARGPFSPGEIQNRNCGGAVPGRRARTIRPGRGSLGRRTGWSRRSRRLLLNSPWTLIARLRFPRFAVMRLSFPGWGFMSPGRTQTLSDGSVTRWTSSKSLMSISGMKTSG